VHTDKPTEIKLGIYINSFHSISEQTMVNNVTVLYSALFWTSIYARWPQHAIWRSYIYRVAQKMLKNCYRSLVENLILIPAVKEF